MIPVRETAARTRRSVLLTAALLLAALLAWGALQACAGGRAFGSDAASEGRQVHVKDGDREEHAIPLDEDGTYTFSTSLGTNTIEVKGGTVNMESADCPNQDCVEQGAIDDETGMIVCMPHQLLVTVE